MCIIYLKVLVLGIEKVNLFSKYLKIILTRFLLNISKIQIEFTK